MGLLFWPFMIASLFLSIFAIKLNKPKLLILSAILILPASLYLAATPRFEIWGIIFPFFYLAAALSIAKKKAWLSLMLIIPNCFLIGWLGFTAIYQ